MLASALAVVPLQDLFREAGWLIDVWLSIAITILPAAWLRRRRAAGALDIWPGVILLVPWLTARFVPTHALAGIVPTFATFHDLRALMSSLHETTRDEVAPVHTTVAVRLVLCALLALLAALIDLIAVVGRRAALAGVPLLVVYTVAGAVRRHPVSWAWFAVAAVAFLILLGLDSADETRRWGRRIAASSATPERVTVPASGPQIAIVAIAAALLVPLLAPAQSRNFISDAFHHSGNGHGTGTAGISPFANLKGQLSRSTAVDLFTVHLANWRPGTKPPFYLRTEVLDEFSGHGWVMGDAGSLTSQESSQADDLPEGTARTTPYSATISVSKLTGTVPVFGRTSPAQISGLPNAGDLNLEFQVLPHSTASRGLNYRVDFDQPNPTQEQLDLAYGDVQGVIAPWLQLPAVPATVRDLVRQLTAAAPKPIQKAKAISDYFTNPQNNFQYSLSTKAGDSGNDLVDFLKNKTGYCQQYAAAMAVMLRTAGVAARVVLGYMHEPPDAKGNFTVTTADAHAWVEAYFTGVGWIPFDPTPIAGLSGGPSSDLSWGPHSYPSSAGNDVQKSRSSAAPSSSAASSVAPSSSAPPAASSGAPGPPIDLTPLWVVLAVLAAVALALAPAAIRHGRRRRRLAAGRAGDPNALWDELADTAVDLGYGWSAARSPRQVASWLARNLDSAEPPDGGAGNAPALSELAHAVEASRYGRAGVPAAQNGALAANGVQATGHLADGLQAITAELRARRPGSTRLLAFVWPASLGVAESLRRSSGRADVRPRRWRSGWRTGRSRSIADSRGH